MAHKIYIPSISRDERIGSVFNHLFRIISDTEVNEDYDIEWDFKNTSFLHPFFLAPLSIYKQNCPKNIICINKNETISSYHSIISFDNTLFVDDNFSKDLSFYDGKTYTPICSFPASNFDVSDKLEQVVQNIIKAQTNYGRELQSPLSYILSEIVCNINQHSRAKNGYIFCQYLRKERTLNLCIADNGDNIFGSYVRTRTLLDKVTDEAIALQYANNGYSTKGLPERGYGLKTSRDMLVNGLGGAYFMLSGSAFYRHMRDSEGAVLLPQSIVWNGTIVLLRIPIDVPTDFNFYNYLED